MFFFYLQAVLLRYIHSSPGWNMMEQHKDVICHFPRHYLVDTQIQTVIHWTIYLSKMDD